MVKNKLKIRKKILKGLNGLSSTSFSPYTASGYQFNINPSYLSLSSNFTNGSNAFNVPYVPLTAKQLLGNPSIAGNSSSPSLGNLALSAGISLLGGMLSNKISNNLFDDNTHFGAITGLLFSQGSNSAINTMANNALKGQVLTSGLGKNVGASVGGAAAGIAANYAGQGITKAMGNSNLGKFTGAAAASAGGTLGGAAVSSALGASSASKFIGMANAAVNPLALGMTAVGAGLGAMNGPSKEYGGKYGDITKTMDTIYDIASVGVNAIPGVGLIISGAMVLNKGMSNMFGSTSGMTKTDAILGSAFMPAPVKWANVIGSKTTSPFKNLSWLNSERASNFMENAFGNLLDKFDKARTEAGKTYGRFSKHAYRRALRNLDFANTAWQLILDMADLDEYQNIRSQDMSSINNLRYAQNILGGFNQLARGKYGMKILNNRINHNTGMRLLSGAALINDGQLILSNLV